MHEDTLGLDLSPMDIERTARYLAARYGESAASVAESRVDAYEEVGKLDAAAIWALIRTEICSFDHPGKCADVNRDLPVKLWRGQ